MPLWGRGMSRAEACPVLRTGQRNCRNVVGREIGCAGIGQDAEFSGLPWQPPRFEIGNETVLDCLTGQIYCYSETG